MVDTDSDAYRAYVTDTDSDAYRAYVTELAGEESASPEDFEDIYQGVWDDEASFAENLACDIGWVSQLEESGNPLSQYIDWEGWARDLFLGGDFYAVEAPGGRVYVFNG